MFTHRFVCMMTDATKAHLDEARDLLPDADLNALFAQAIATLVERTRMKKRRMLKKTRELGAERTGADENVASSADSQASGQDRERARELQETIAVGPSTHTRYIPATIARAVFVRDNNQCQFKDDNGRQCCSTRHLQLHHLDPWARGGATTIANLKIYCRSHNAYQAELDYGPRDVAGPQPAFKSQS